MLWLILAGASVRAQEASGGEGNGGPQRPVGVPAPLRPGRIDPDHGVQFGLGFPALKVESDALSGSVEGGTLSQTGVIVNADAVLGAFRIGYARHLSRQTVPAEVRYAGETVDLLSFDADQLWGFHGFRVMPLLYLGYGLGWQRRTVRVVKDGQTVAGETESGFLAGLMADWAVGLPFTLQLRWFRDLEAGFIEMEGVTLQITYLTGF